MTEDPKKPDKPKKKGPDKNMIFMAMGIEAFVAVLGGFWLGLQADVYLGKRGLGPALGSTLFLVFWFVHILHVMKQMDKEP